MAATDLGVAQIGIYAEFSGSHLNIAQIGIYAEFSENKVVFSFAGMYVEMSDPLPEQDKFGPKIQII